jgi:hypothetical protein
MTRTKSFRSFAVLAVLMTFLLAGTAEAGSFNSSKNVGSFELSVFSQAWDWFSSLWSASTTATPPQDGGTSTPNPTPPCTANCTDSGWGIDPNGGN